MKLEGLFEEVPIVLKRSHLLQQLLAQEYEPHDLHTNSKILQIFQEQYSISHMYKGFVSE